MMRAIVLTAVLLLPAALGDHDPGCSLSATQAEIDTGPTLAGHFYINYDPHQEWPVTYSLWIYQESNGVPGQQRNDLFADDTCGHPELADTLIY